MQNVRRSFLAALGSTRALAEGALNRMTRERGSVGATICAGRLPTGQPGARAGFDCKHGARHSLSLAPWQGRRF